MAKIILNTSEDYFDFMLFGIVCQENQYHIVSAINQYLKINLCLTHFLPYNLKDGKLFNFSLYTFIDEDLGVNFQLIPNQSNFEEPNIIDIKSNDLFAEVNVDERVKLIKELPKTDYFLLVKGEDIYNYQTKIIDKLKLIPEVIQVQFIEANELASKRNLIF